MLGVTRKGGTALTGFRDLLVHVDDTPACEARLTAARDLARAGSAHLTGLAIAEVMMIPEFMPGPVMEQLHADARERNDRLRGRFEAGVRGEPFTTEWRATDQLEAGGTVLDLMALHARYADLAIVGQPDPAADRPVVPTDLPAQLAVLSGRPVMGIPRDWRPGPVGRRVLVAWDGGREAARAVNDALPLLRGADAVRVATFTRSDRATGHGDVPGADLATHLARHDVHVESQHSIMPDVGAGDAILDAADEYRADLIVMGAYGRARLREFVLGGATRQVLRSMTRPVLMAH